ncbi:MAG: carboxymuconolactone decarboxylase family protein [Candidatus Lindowbacteria bacterium]|nr:carboxymuconolactone decarboxylase family protein [Candidatus Lindowbacteria bacterium]
MTDHFYAKDAVLSGMGKFAEVKSDLLVAFGQFNQKAFEPGALPEKTKELIALACAHITQCPYCIDSHTRKAKEAAATDEEIAEAIMVAVAMKAGAAMAHASIAMKALENI